ncbi:MAG: ribosome recycling factor [Clostridiales Family XIII bacterium]|jgi:ribosome recycling factor|nr:ribosome recycling factor [Clostridiales Family XIII bacterium]
MANEIEIKDKLKAGIERANGNFIANLNTIRAGQANPTLLDKVTIMYYDTKTPLKALANISASDPQTLIISPFDVNSIKDIEKGILVANVGGTLSNDGKLIRLVIPPLTEEIRKEFTKDVKKYAEETKISIRNDRRIANDGLKKLEKAGDFTEDDLKSEEKEVQKIIDIAIKKIDQLEKDKIKELLTL